MKTPQGHTGVRTWLLLFVMSLASIVQAEDVTVTTYYPSPRGNYQTLSTTGNTNLATGGGAVAVGTAGNPATLAVTGATTLSGTITLPALVPSCPAGTTKLSVSTTPPVGELVCVADTSLPSGSAGDTLRNTAAGSNWVANNLIYNDGTQIGIGTASPILGAVLDVVGNVRLGTSAYDSWFPYNGDNSVYLTGAQHIFRSGAPYTERMRIDGSGNVGIGMSPAPGAQLDVWLTVRANDFVCRVFGGCIDSADVTFNYAGSTSKGGPATSIALNPPPTTCPSGQYARGIAANGNATGCSPDVGGGGGVASSLLAGAGVTLTIGGSPVGSWNPGVAGDATIAASGVGGTVTAGSGLTGGGALPTTLNVGAGTGISVGADTVGLANPSKACGVGQAIQAFDLSSGLAPTCLAPGGGIGGSGTTNYVSKWTASTTLGNSSIFDDGLSVTIIGGSGDLYLGGPPQSGNLIIRDSGGAIRIRLNSDADSYISTGNVGIGTTIPGAKLEVAGQIKITGGAPGTGKVLTSDATGLASWVTPGVGGGTFPLTAGAGITLSTGATWDPDVGPATITASAVGGTVTAGSGLTGGGALPTTLNVGAGTGIAVDPDAIRLANPTKSCGAGTAIQTFDVGSGAAPTCIPTAGGGLSGSGTNNWVTKWTGGTALGNSAIFDDGSSTSILNGSGDLYLGGGTSGQSGNLNIRNSANVTRIQLNSDATSWFLDDLQVQGSRVCTAANGVCAGGGGTVTAGNGLTGGGALPTTLNVGAGTGISVAADTVGLANPSKGCGANTAIQNFDLGNGNAPGCIAVGGGGLTGSGTAGRVPRWNTGTDLGDSGITDNGSIIIGGGGGDLYVGGTAAQGGGNQGGNVFVRSSGGAITTTIDGDTGTIRGSTNGFGGMYYRVVGSTCLGPNNFTGACSCPIGFSEWTVAIIGGVPGIGWCPQTQCELRYCYK